LTRGILNELLLHSIKLFYYLFVQRLINKCINFSFIVPNVVFLKILLEIIVIFGLELVYIFIISTKSQQMGAGEKKY